MADEKTNTEKGLEQVAAQLAEMKEGMLTPDAVKALMAEQAEAEAKDRTDEAEKAEEKAAKEKAGRDPALVVTPGEAQKNAARGYGFRQARRDFEKGRTATVPYWTDEQEDEFSIFAKAVADDDKKVISKMMCGEKTAPYTETTTAGGYLIPVDYRSELIRVEYVKSLMLQKCRILPIKTLTTYLPSMDTRTTATWGAINTAIGDTKVTLGQVTLTAAKLVGASYVPSELMQDSFLSMGGLLVDEFTDSFARKIDNEVLEGDATDSDHTFDGWSDDTNVHRTCSGDSGDSLAGSLEVDHILATIGTLDELEIAGAEWYIHPTNWATVRGLADTNSDLLVNIDKDYRYRLFGFPVNLTSQVTAAATQGNVGMWFGNAKHIIIGDHQDFNLKASEEFVFLTDQVTFRAIQRLAIAVALGTSLAVLTRTGTDGGSDPA